MTHRIMSDIMTDRDPRVSPAVISHTPSRVPEILSVVITAAVFAGGFLLTVSQVLA